MLLKTLLSTILLLLVACGNYETAYDLKSDYAVQLRLLHEQFLKEASIKYPYEKFVSIYFGNSPEIKEAFKDISPKVLATFSDRATRNRLKIINNELDFQQYKK
jgi:hypothetical protein